MLRAAHRHRGFDNKLPIRLLFAPRAGGAASGASMTIMTAMPVPVGALAWRGVVTGLHLCPRAFLPMRSVETLTLIAGRGIAGDRYCNETGFYSNLPEIGRQITLFEEETLEALKRDHGVELEAH